MPSFSHRPNCSLLRAEGEIRAGVRALALTFLGWIVAVPLLVVQTGHLFR